MADIDLFIDPDATAEETPILKYADTTKQSFFDYIITESFEGGRRSHKLVHGDFDAVAKKIRNSDLVIGLAVKREFGRQDLTYIVGTGFLSSEFDSEYMGPDAITIYIGTKEGLVYWLSDNTIITDLPGDGESDKVDDSSGTK